MGVTLIDAGWPNGKVPIKYTTNWRPAELMNRMKTDYEKTLYKTFRFFEYHNEPTTELTFDCTSEAKAKTWLLADKEKTKRLCAKMLKDSVETINKALGVEVFVDYVPRSHTRFVELSYGGGKSRGIGNEVQRTLPVTVDKPTTALHELMHVYGFVHEQFHPQFPWNKVKTTGLEYSSAWSLVQKGYRSALYKIFNKHANILFQVSSLSNGTWHHALHTKLSRRNMFGWGSELGYMHAMRLTDDDDKIKSAKLDLNSRMLYGMSGKSLFNALKEWLSITSRDRESVINDIESKKEELARELRRSGSLVGRKRTTKGILDRITFSPLIETVDGEDVSIIEMTELDKQTILDVYAEYS